MKPFANTITPKGYHTCHDCGYQWQTGVNGDHSCTVWLQKRLAASDDLKAKYDAAVEALMPLAKIGKVWKEDRLVHFPYLETKDMPASKVYLITNSDNGDAVLTLADVANAVGFFNRLGIKL